MKKLILSFTLSFIIMGVEAQDVKFTQVDKYPKIEHEEINRPILIIKSGDTITNGGMAYAYFAKPPDRYDTVKVVMLFSDTELKEYEGEQMGIKYDYKDFDYSVRWRAGYAVIKNKARVTEYLDAEKKKLNPSIIVWMSK